MDKKTRDLLTKIEKYKKELAKDRDSLRDALLELDEIVGDCDSGIQDIEDGQRLIEAGLDSISKFV